MEKIPDVNVREKSLCSGRFLRTLLPREKLLLEHIFDGVAKGKSSCLIPSISISLWQSVCLDDMLRQVLLILIYMIMLYFIFFKT